MAAAAADMALDAAGDGRRASIEKKPVSVPVTVPVPVSTAEASRGLDVDDAEPPAFERLPDEIIQQYAPTSLY
jgi:hypothetical protein